MRKKILIAVLLLAFGEGVNYYGGVLNRFVEQANGGRMPVWCWNEHLLMQTIFDIDHQPLGPETRYKIFCDIIPIVYFMPHQVGLGMVCAGDVMIYGGFVLIILSYFYLPVCLILSLPRLFRDYFKKKAKDGDDFWQWGV